MEGIYSSGALPKKEQISLIDCVEKFIFAARADLTHVALGDSSSVVSVFREGSRGQSRGAIFHLADQANLFPSRVPLPGASCEEQSSIWPIKLHFIHSHHLHFERN